MALCTRCGQQTEAEAEFCPACGGYAAGGYAGGPTLAGAVAAAAGPVQHTSAAGAARDYLAAGAYAPVRYAPPDGYPPAPRADEYQFADGDPATGGALRPATAAAATGGLRYEQSTADPDPRELWYAPSAPAGNYRGEQPSQHADDERWPFGPDAASAAPQTADAEPWLAQQTAEPQPWPAQQTAEPPAVLYAPRPFRLDAPGAIPAEPRPWHSAPPGLGSPDHAAGLAQPSWPESHFPGQDDAAQRRPSTQRPATPRRRTTTPCLTCWPPETSRPGRTLLPRPDCRQLPRTRPHQCLRQHPRTRPHPRWRQHLSTRPRTGRCWPMHSPAISRPVRTRLSRPKHRHSPATRRPTRPAQRPCIAAARAAAAGSRSWPPSSS